MKRHTLTQGTPDEHSAKNCAASIFVFWSGLGCVREAPPFVRALFHTDSCPFPFLLTISIWRLFTSSTHTRQTVIYYSTRQDYVKMTKRVIIHNAVPAEPIGVAECWRKPIPTAASLRKRPHYCCNVYAKYYDASRTESLHTRTYCLSQDLSQQATSNMSRASLAGLPHQPTAAKSKTASWH